jgi:S-methylmethionine-dependent homocysteine/selenocysteine methylase
MSTNANMLPQTGNRVFLSDGGIETDLIFNDGIDLPHFAAFVLMKDEEGRDALTRYFERYIAIAKSTGLGFILESPTWRASADWGAKLGWSRAALSSVNRDAISLMHQLKERHGDVAMPLVVSGCIGPRGDGYVAGEEMTADEAETFHSKQIAAFAGANAELVTAMTMTNANEATGIARAARRAGLPVVIAFTVETDSRLPTGQPLGDAIAAVDAATDNAPAYYMVNCAHPTHFETELAKGGSWTKRIRGVRANASRRSHQELNDAPDLDAGDPVELGGQYRTLRLRHPQMTVFGGCCGTDCRHIECIGRAVREAA